MQQTILSQTVYYRLTRKMFPVKFSVLSKQEMHRNASVLHFTQALYTKKCMKIWFLKDLICCLFCFCQNLGQKGLLLRVGMAYLGHLNEVCYLEKVPRSFALAGYEEQSTSIFRNEVGPCDSIGASELRSRGLCLFVTAPFSQKLPDLWGLWGRLWRLFPLCFILDNKYLMSNN